MDGPSATSDVFVFGSQQGYSSDGATGSGGLNGVLFGDVSVEQEEASYAFSSPLLFHQLADDAHGLGDSTERRESKRTLEDNQNFSAGGDHKRRKKDATESWDTMYSRLVEYRNLYGNCLVPKRFAQDPKLGTWVETQRVQYKRLERAIDEESGAELVAPNNRLTPVRLEKLRAIGFVWTAKPARKRNAVDMGGDTFAPAPSQAKRCGSVSGKQKGVEDWNEMYLRLAAFKEQEGHCLPPRKYDADPRLPAWVELQRSIWNRQNRVHGDVGSISAPGGRALVPEPILPTAPSGNHVPEQAPGAPDVMGDGSAMVARVARSNSSPLLLMTEKKLSPEQKAKLDALGFVWSLRSRRVDEHWENMFQQLVAYKETHGHAQVPSRWEANIKLSKWVETQRYEFTKLHRSANETTEGNECNAKPRASNANPNPRLTEDRIRRLESIGFEWRVKQKTKRYFDKQWDEMFQRLLLYREQHHGNTLIPKRYPPDPRLGTWAATQRVQYKKLMEGRPKQGDAISSDSGDDPQRGLSDEEMSFRLTDDRRRRLDDIGFVWNVRESDKSVEQGCHATLHDNHWDAMFLRLKAYKETYHDCLVPKRFKEDSRLGTWVDTQRVQYKKIKKALAEKKTQIDGVESGDASAVTPTAALKTIMGRLTQERIRRLDELGFVWSLRDDWNKHYEELCVFHREHGHCRVPARHAKNKRLGIWVSAQRQHHHKIMQQAGQDPHQRQRPSPLTQERIGLLNRLGFTWTIRSQNTYIDGWTHRYQQLVQFKSLNGTCNVSEDTGELGAWVRFQREEYRRYMRAKGSGRSGCRTSMTEDRIRLLEEVGFAWTAVETATDAYDIDYDQHEFAVEEAAAMDMIDSTGTSEHVLDPTRIQLIQAIEDEDPMGNIYDTAV